MPRMRLSAEPMRVARDLLIGALVAAALIAGPTQTAEKHLLAKVSGFQSKAGASPTRSCSAPCAPAAPDR